MGKVLFSENMRKFLILEIESSIFRNIRNFLILELVESYISWNITKFFGVDFLKNFSSLGLKVR